MLNEHVIIIGMALLVYLLIWRGRLGWVVGAWADAQRGATMIHSKRDLAVAHVVAVAVFLIGLAFVLFGAVGLLGVL